ncbi:MAG: TAXI family TRAP transporter solute-binding subunit [Acidobacteria bacterium]|nr:TAXI family TRAP transporter solute-binding subunit [Acidobacteriota bacterium]
MRPIRLRFVAGIFVLLASLAGGAQVASAQEPAPQKAPALGYAAKKPVFGGACTMCPWGSMADVVKEALKPYGWDIQICYVCAGGPRAARLVAGKVVPPKPEPGSNQPMPPDAPLDLGATGTEFLWWAYQGTNAFAEDPEGPRKDLRLVANIQQPSYFLVAVKADSPITDLRQIVENRMAVKFMLADIMRDASHLTNHYNLTEEKLKSFGGELVGSGPQNRENLDVVAGWASLITAPEYSYWYEVTQKYNLRFLELPKDLIEQWAKEGNMQVRNVPVGLFRGLERPFPTVAKSGTVVYGRTDMPDEFAYTLAKALDEHQDLLQWTHMNFSYNARTVWKAFGVPLHPGAARYYKERGYMK